MALQEDNLLLEVRSDHTEKYQYGVMGGQVLYHGALINICNYNHAHAGYAKIAADNTNEYPLGIVVSQTVDATDDEDGIKNVTVAVCGTFSVPLTMIDATIADIGRYVFATDDDTLSFAATNVDPFGKIVAIDDQGRPVVRMFGLGGY